MIPRGTTAALLIRQIKGKYPALLETFEIGTLLTSVKVGVNYSFTLRTRTHLEGTVIQHGRNSQHSNAVHFEDAF